MVNPHTNIRKKVGGKIFSQKTCHDKLLLPLFISVKLSLRPKNQWVALVPFKLSVALNTWKRRHNLSTNLIQNVSVSRPSLKHLSTDSLSLMIYSSVFNCKSGPFIKSRKILPSQSFRLSNQLQYFPESWTTLFINPSLISPSLKWVFK